MKKLAPLLMLGLLLSGCARHYVITMNNGSQIATTSKPRVKGNSYVFKDASGAERSVSTGAVSEIAPASMSSNNRSMQYNPSAK